MSKSNSSQLYQQKTRVPMIKRYPGALLIISLREKQKYKWKDVAEARAKQKSVCTVRKQEAICNLHMTTKHI